MAGALSYTMTDTTKLSTSEYYGKALVELGERYKDVVALTADLAKSTNIYRFMDAYPDRFFNVGIAEQNMIGMAAGMAKAGLKPYASTFGVFASLRCADQVHADICYQNVNCKIIGTHAGVSYGQGGSTHHAIEDIAVMRSMANMTVIVPSDGHESGQAIRASYFKDGPVYIRVNRGFDYELYQDHSFDYDTKTATETFNGVKHTFEIGKGITLREGTDVTIIACGSCVWQAIEAAKMLEFDSKLSIRVINMHTIKPIDKELVQKAVQETRRIVTVEDHSVIGGLGSAVAEIIADYGKGCAFLRLGHQDKFSAIGFHEDLLGLYELDANGITKNIKELMNKDFEADDAWDDEV